MPDFSFKLMTINIFFPESESRICSSLTGTSSFATYFFSKVLTVKELGLLGCSFYFAEANSGSGNCSCDIG